MSPKWRNWYRNEVDEEIKRVESRVKVKHNERSDQLFLEDDILIYFRNAPQSKVMLYKPLSGILNVWQSPA